MSHKALKYVMLSSLTSSLLFLGFTSTAFAIQKISSNPASVTINEGSSQDVHISLAEPIICPTLGTCDVTLTFNSLDAHVSGAALHWNYNEWFQPWTLTINTTSDGIYTGDRTVDLTATAVSDSEYYNGYVITVPVTVVDQDPAPPAPAVTNKSVTLTTGKSIVVDVLTGISGDPDASTLIITKPPQHGKAVDPPNTITYTPNKGFVGHDGLTYRVCSSLSNLICSSATLSFTVVAATVTAPNTGLLQESVLLPITLVVTSIVLAFVVRARFLYIR